MQHDTRTGDVPVAHGQGLYAYQLLGGVLWRRSWSVLLGVAAGLALGVLACALLGPWYESSAQVLVLKKHLDTAPISGPEQGRPPEEYLATHMLLIVSPRVVERAVAKADLAKLAQFRKGASPTRQLAAALPLLPADGTEGGSEVLVAREIIACLTVSSDAQRPGMNPSNEVLNLSFRSKAADDCPQVLNAVIASYQDFLKETYRNTNAEALELITQARDVLHKDLEARETAYHKFLQETPPAWKGKDGNTIHQDRLFNIDARRAALQVRKAEVEATLEAVDGARKNGRDPVALLAWLSPVPANRDVVAPHLLTNPEPWTAGRNTRDTLEEELINLQLQEQKLLEVYGQKHPEVQALRQRQETVRRLILPASGAAADPATPPQTGADLTALKIELLRRELHDLQAADTALAGLFEREQKAAGTSFLHEVEDESHRNGIERSRLLYESVLHRFGELNSVKDFGGYDTQVIGPPRQGELALKRYALVFGLTLLAGLLGGLGFAYVAEVRDRRLRTAQEVRQRLGLPVIGQVPRAPSPATPLPRNQGRGEQAASPPPYPSVYPPAAAAYRELRTVVLARAAAEGARVLQIISPGAGDGRTALACNLAACLAEAGKRVLLVDTDFRQPRLHEMFGLAGNVGLSSVLAATADPESVTQQSGIPGLAVLPSGPPPANPAELLASPRLQETLAALGRRYDFVLLDTPPLLHATDPAAVAPCADQVLLVLRLAHTERHQAERARELLQLLGAKVLGVVVNE
jgi:capsular exopolysaccharide synthesis family protein